MLLKARECHDYSVKSIVDKNDEERAQNREAFNDRALLIIIVFVTQFPFSHINSIDDCEATANDEQGCKICQENLSYSIEEGVLQIVPVYIRRLWGSEHVVPSEQIGVFIFTTATKFLSKPNEESCHH